jgi:hypothetical protein
VKSPEATDLVNQYGLNSYSAQYVLEQTGSFQAMAMELDDTERIKVFGSVVGEGVMVSASPTVALL